MSEVSNRLLLSYYGDDLTGSTDVMEALASHGVDTVLFMNVPDEELLARFSHCKAIGLAGTSRLTRNPGAGMDFRVYQQFWRLLGVDQFQINGIRVKYWEPDESFVNSFKAVSTPLFEPSDCPLPVAGSGQWGGQAPETYERTGRTTDLLYLCGGGIVSHPGGPAAGVRAVQQAWEAAVAGIPLETYAADHPELAASLAKFGKGGE